MPFDLASLYSAGRSLSAVTIRAALDGDIDCLSAMVAQAANMHAQIAPRYFRSCPPASTTLLRATLKTMIESSATQQLFVAICDARAIALAQVGIEEQPQKLFRHAGRVSRLSWLWVEKGFRRRGIAQDLLRAVEDWSRAQDCREVMCHVLASNGPSQSLFQASGYADQTRILSFDLQPQNSAENR